MGRFLRLLLLLLWWGGVTVHGEELLSLATQAIQKKEYKKAEFLLERAKKMGENAVFIEYSTGYLNFMKGDAYGAIQSFRKATQMSPQFVGAYLNLARIYFKIQNYAEAVDVIKKCMENVPDSVESYLLLGDIYNYIGAYDLGQKAYERVSAIDPSFEDSFLSLSDLYQKLGDNDKSMDIIDLGIKTTGTESVNFLKRKAAIYRDEKEYMKAAALYEYLIDNAPKDMSKEDIYDLYLDLISLYTEGKYNLMALNVLKRIIPLYPEKNDLEETLIQIYTENGRESDALDYFDKLFDQNKALAYRGIRKLFSQAYLDEKRPLLADIMNVYDKRKLSDDLYRTTKQKFF